MLPTEYQKGREMKEVYTYNDFGFKELAKGEFCNINVTSQYVYFTDFVSNKEYCTSTQNPDTIKALQP